MEFYFLKLVRIPHRRYLWYTRLQVVAALKGIRSIRHIEDSLIDRLAQCVTDKNVKARVKVAALEAFRADPCTAKVIRTDLTVQSNNKYLNINGKRYI